MLGLPLQTRETQVRSRPISLNRQYVCIRNQGVRPLIFFQCRRIAINGFLYVWSRDGANGKQHLDCKRVRGKECKARAVTQRVNDALTLKKGGKISDHLYHDEVRAEEIKLSLKRTAVAANVPPAAILQGKYLVKLFFCEF